VGRAVDLASPGGDRPVELLLMRQLASYLRTSIFLMGPDGTLLYFNESSEALLGRRFDETEPMNAEQWSTLLQSEDERGAPIEIDARPIVVALRRQQPSHRTFSIRGFDGVRPLRGRPEARSSAQASAIPPMRDVTERPLPELRGRNALVSPILGGQLDVCVLGAYQVAANGDLANWHTGQADAIPAVGGAMDLAIGARKTWVMMEHITKSGEPRVVPRCTYPITGLGCVSRVYTDLAVLDITPAGLVLREMAQGLDFAALQACTGAPLIR
jgi:PAS domain-containing protein